MDQLIVDAILGMALTVPLAIMVGMKAGRVINQINSINIDQKVNEITIETLKDKIVDRLSILLRVYSDTNENVNLPTGVNLQEVSARFFFENTEVSILNNIYSDLLFQGTESKYFLQVLEFFIGG